MVGTGVFMAKIELFTSCVVIKTEDVITTCPACFRWYHGAISRSKSEQILLSKSGNRYSQPDGAFLVRRSESDQSLGEFSLSVK